MDVCSDQREFLEGNCGRLTVRGGLKAEESVKITSNGWTKEDSDFVVHLVTDETPKVAKLRQIEARRSLAREAGSTQPVAEDLAGSQQPAEEQPVTPIIGVRIPGAVSVDEGKKAAVLLYKNNPTEPTEIPLDTPAGPTTPFMIFFSQKSTTEMMVTVYTWQSE